MGLSSLNLPNYFFESIYISTSKIVTLQICTDWANSFFCLLWNCCLIVSLVVMLGNTKYVICYLSCLSHLWLYRPLLHSESSFPRLKSPRLLILLPEEATPKLWVSVYFFLLFPSVPSLWLFQQVTWVACGIQEMNKELMRWHHAVTISEVTGHKTRVNGWGSKTWKHWRCIDFIIPFHFIGMYVSTIYVYFAFIFASCFLSVFLFLRKKYVSYAVLLFWTLENFNLYFNLMWPSKFKRAQGILMLTSKAPQSLEKSILDDLVNWKWDLMHFPTMIQLHPSLAVKLSSAKSCDASTVSRFFSIRWIFSLHNQYKFFMTCTVSSHSYLGCLQGEKLPCIFPAPWGGT